MPILIVAMVAIPALLLSFTSSGNAQAQANGTVGQPTSPLTPTPSASNADPICGADVPNYRLYLFCAARRYALCHCCACAHIDSYDYASEWHHESESPIAE